MPIKTRLKKIVKEWVPNRFIAWRLGGDRVSLSLTFDDGPHPEFTLEILQILRTYGVRATFFLVGENVEKHPDLVREIVREGHEVGNHSFSHRVVTGLSNREIWEEFDRTNEAISQCTGHNPRFIRPPKGVMDLRFLWYSVCRRYTVVMWSVDPMDYQAEAPEVLINRIDLQIGEGGNIILLHERHAQTVEMLPRLLERASGENRVWVTAGDILV